MMKIKKTRTEETGFDYEKFEKQAIEGLQSGKGLVGTEGLLKGLIKHLVESALDGELDHHISQSKQAQKPNRRNGHTSKVLRTLSRYFLSLLI